MNLSSTLSQEDMDAFGADLKIGILATLDSDGAPHLSLITTLQAGAPRQLIFGQFCEGWSKEHVRQNPKTGFLIMSLERKFWRGKAFWTHEKQEGQAYELFNQKPLFRYNTYFGVHTAHFMDLVGVTRPRNLNLVGIAAGVAALAPRMLWGTRGGEAPVLTSFALTHLNKPDTLKFLAYLDDDGYPMIVPVVPTIAANRERLLIAPTVFRSELAAIPHGSQVAVLGLNLEMESVLARGTWRPVLGQGRLGGSGLGPYSLQLDFLYNSMPPKQGQIYPPVPLQAVRDFS